MEKTLPPSDYIVYVVVIGVVAAMMLGKYLMAKWDKPIEKVLEEDLQKDIKNLEHELEDIVDDIGDKINAKP